MEIKRENESRFLIHLSETTVKHNDYLPFYLVVLLLDRHWNRDLTLAEKSLHVRTRKQKNLNQKVKINSKKIQWRYSILMKGSVRKPESYSKSFTWHKISAIFQLVPPFF